MGSSHVTESVVSQILTELDGLEELKNVTVVAATNRPDMIDPALLRPGRLERHIYVPPPDEEGRKKIFDVYLRDACALLTDDISIDHLVQQTNGYVGADVEALVRQAKLGAMRDFITVMADTSEKERQDAVVNIRITRKHFEDAAKIVKGSLDQDAIEAAERQAWEMLYNQDQREILENALATLTRAGLRKVMDNSVLTLREETFRTKKDFTEIIRLTSQLDEQLTQTT